MKTGLKIDLENLVQKYETKEFIENDPIQFPHRFKNERDIELAGFISSVFIGKGCISFFISSLFPAKEIKATPPRAKVIIPLLIYSFLILI